jgi:hypothetical protein
MGIDPVTLTLASIAVVSTVGKMTAEEQAAEANLSALDRQAKLNALQYQQKNLQNIDITEKMLSRQAAQLSTRGVAFDSPSFNAIQRETLNVGARKAANLQTEESLNKQAIDIEKRNVKTTLYAQLFGDVANVALGGTEIYRNAPKKLPQVEEL